MTVINDEESKKSCEQLNPEKVSSILTGGAGKRAEKAAKDPDAFEKKMRQLEEKLSRIPGLGGVFEYVPTLISLALSALRKEYTGISLVSVGMIIAALLYCLSPLDIIPDVIPGCGMLDDSMILSGCVGLIKNEMDDYREWREACM